MAEYTEHRTRGKDKPPEDKPTSSYGKKFLRQLILCALISAVIFVPELSGKNASEKIKSAVKSAVSYTVDTKQITASFESFLNSVSKKLRIKNEDNADEAAKQNTESL